MSGGAGGMRGGTGGFQNQFINPNAAGGAAGYMNGGPQANYNGMNIGNRVPFKGGTTEAQMQANMRGYMAARNGQEPAGSFSGGVMGTNMDPRRSPDVAAPWRIAQPYAGPVYGGAPQPPNPAGQPWRSPYAQPAPANPGAPPAMVQPAGMAAPPISPGPSPYQNPTDYANPPINPGPSGYQNPMWDGGPQNVGPAGGGPSGYQNPPGGLGIGGPIGGNPGPTGGGGPAGIGGPTGGNAGPTRNNWWDTRINTMMSPYSGLLGR